MQSVCQSGVLLQAQPLATDSLGQTAGQDDLPELLLRKTASISSGQRVEQGFAPLGKGSFHHGKIAPSSPATGGAAWGVSRTTAEVTFGAGR